MKSPTTVVCVAVFAAQLSTAPAQAMDNESKAALGALAILGIAALSHNENHYHEGYKPSDEQQTAQFERGFRDGLHNEPYDSRHSSRDYGLGYDAGHKERANRLAHKRRDVKGTSVPVKALQACRTEAASSWGVGGHDVHVVKAGQEGSDNYYIEIASGHRHVICGSNGDGQVFNLRNGRL